MSDFLDLSEEQIQIPVRLRIDGEPKWFAICEISGSQRTSWLNFVRTKSKTNRDGSISIKDFSGITPNLLKKSVYEAEVTNVGSEEEPNYRIDSIGDAITDGQINQLSSRVQQNLFDKVKLISGLDTDQTEGNE